MKARFLTSGVLAIAAVVAAAASAQANTITVTSAGVVAGVFSYQITEDSAGRISGVGVAPVGTTSFNAAGTDIDDYFTIYDFNGYTGVHTDPAGWAFSSTLVGPTDSHIVPTDSGSVVNLTWYKIGGSSGAGPFTVTGFSATTSFTGSTVNGEWSSEDTQVGGGADGITNASSGHVVTPSASPVPEPGSMLLLGSGLMGLASAARRRFRK